MSKLKDHAKKSVVADKALQKAHGAARVTNFMGGNSYVANPIDTLKMIAASSIFAEPSYYRNGYQANATIKNFANVFRNVGTYFHLKGVTDAKATTLDVFTQAIDNALDFDFGKTLALAKVLRTDYNMRLNPAVIYMRAIMHSNRAAFNQKFPGMMRNIGKDLVLRPDDMTNQFEYYMFAHGSKNSLPSIAKRMWADKLESLRPYHLAKYKSKSLIDLVRIAHPKPTPGLTELIKTGNVTVSDDDKTWETLRSSGKKWLEIYGTIKIPHMALLRNLRGIFTEVNDAKIAAKVIEDLKGGVPYGRQFPFRYYSAYKEIEKATLNHKQMLLDGLEDCIDIAVQNFPKLEGRVACLSDNSGSSWGAVNSEYGTTKVAEIANLSSIITASRADEGFVGLFGDSLLLEPVSKRNGILKQLEHACRVGPKQGGKGDGNTENGIWMFFRDALKNKVKYDTVFIYSDMQAGHGGLYGTNPGEYREYLMGSRHIDVLKLVAEYRAKVNPKLNVFSVQVAGYNNSVLPENLYRGAILAGWTGNETTYAQMIISTWDELESRNAKSKNQQ